MKKNLIFKEKGYIRERTDGQVAEWFKAHAWKVCVGLKLTGGSNPLLSANIKAPRPGAFLRLIYPRKFEHFIHKK